MPTRDELEALRRLAELEARAKIAPAQEEPSQLPGFLVQSGKDLLRGMGRTAESVGKFLTLTQPSNAVVESVLRSQGKTPPNLLETSATDLALPRNPDQTPEEARLTSALEGAGGMAFGSLRSLPNNMAAGAGGSMAHDLADKALEGQNPIVRKIGAVLAGMGAGSGLAWLGGPKGQPATPENKVGRDTQALTDIALNRVNPNTVDPLTVANQTSNVANRIVGGAVGQRSENYGNNVQGNTVRGLDVASMIQALRQMGRTAATDGEAEAYNEIANNLIRTTPNGSRVITDLQGLSSALKGLKENPPSQNASASRKISDANWREALGAAEAMLRGVSPEYMRANRQMAYESRTIVDPLKEGPIGRMADTNPNVAAPTPVSRLENLVKDQSPESITQNVGRLGIAGANTREIARALMERKLGAGGNSPGMRLLGAPGSGNEAQINALLETTGVNPQAVTAPLRAADSLAGTLPPQQSATEYVSVHPKGISLRGVFRPRGAGQSQKDYQAQIAEILSTATPQERQQLFGLSMFDNDLRKALAVWGAVNPGIQAEGAK